MELGEWAKLGAKCPECGNDKHLDADVGPTGLSVDYPEGAAQYALKVLRDIGYVVVAFQCFNDDSGSPHWGEVISWEQEFEEEYEATNTTP